MVGALRLKDMVLEFNYAIEKKFKLFAVEVRLPNTSTNEIIINRLAGIRDKLEYYKNAYDENLCLKTNSQVQIVGYDFADFVDELKFFDNEG